MRITNVKINGITNPVGFLYEKLFCSWNVCETESQKAANTVIEVSETEDFKEILYKKEGAELCQSGELLDISLEARTRYFYRIIVTGDRGDQAISEGCFFETGKMDETWNAQWIAPKAEDSFHPILKKTFYAKENIKKARLYVTGVGLFEAYLNGKKIGNEYLMLLARAIQLFMPGKPQIWYLDLFAGKNDHEAVRRAGESGHKEINRTNLLKEKIEESLKTDVVQKQLELLRMRNTSKAFSEEAEIKIFCENACLDILWEYGEAFAKLHVDFEAETYIIETNE